MNIVSIQMILLLDMYENIPLQIRSLALMIRNNNREATYLYRYFPTKLFPGYFPLATITCLICNTIIKRSLFY